MRPSGSRRQIARQEREDLYAGLSPLLCFGWMVKSQEHSAYQNKFDFGSFGMAQKQAFSILDGLRNEIPNPN